MAPFDLSEDWNTATSTRTNVLVLAPDDTIRLITGVCESAHESLMVWHPGAALDLPPIGYCGTLLLNHVGNLSQRDQLRLLEWLEADARQTHVVSTTTRCVVPLLESGLFLEALYYRLNMLVCEISNVAVTA